MERRGVFLAIAMAVVLCVVTEGRKHCQQYLVERHHRNVRSWDDARDRCRRQGMDLVKIDNQEEDAFLQSILRDDMGGRNQEGWYIGGKYNGREWRWADGSRMDYQNFPGTTGFTSGMQVTNYAVIFINRSYPPSFDWGYLSPRSSNKVGFICEATWC